MDVLELLKLVHMLLKDTDQLLLLRLQCLIFAVCAFVSKDRNVSCVVYCLLITSFFDSQWGLLTSTNKSELGYYFDMPEYYQRAFFYIINSFFDGFVIFIILYRLSLVSFFVRAYLHIRRFFSLSVEAVPLVFYRHKDEYKIIIVFAISILVNLLTAIEYPIRWNGYEQALYFYYSYTTIKIILNIYLLYYVFRLVRQTQKK